ncbi:hypothetical protein HNP55_000717 [Paucibacter oligotrophus]|uniref:Calcineurin-like phosphoesterase domain-containing protein n=1 Tax=Roseateles oligotrophus TaxID=1769250 RepID=A0A840L6A9_9BURK|nr:metallophosphoesterase [Roseateles oligotrophus]MBB4842222.1 hypothetical protein [Roseateles oligotrophus]
MPASFPFFPLFRRGAAPLCSAAVLLALGACSSLGPVLQPRAGLLNHAEGPGARVCLDLNDNARCDSDEPATQAGPEGRFTLASDGRHAWLAEIAAAQADAEQPRLRLRALPGQGDEALQLSWLSTVLAAQAEAGLTREPALASLAARAGVSVAELLEPGTADALGQDLIRRFALDQEALLEATLAAWPQAPMTALRLASPRLEAPGRLYVWSQFSDSSQAPFSTAHFSGVSSGGQAGSLANELPISPAGAKVAAATTADLAARYQLSEPTLGQGRQVARSISAGSDCPALLVDGRLQAMQVRAPAVRGLASNAASQTGDRLKPIPADFEVLTCEALLPEQAQVVAINGQRLKLLQPAALLKRVVVVGDTGCRVQGPSAIGQGKPGAPLQDCSDESDWPWRKIARAAASFNPDLIIHNGDIHYREGTPKGTEPGQSLPNEARYAKYLQTITYGWKAWDADFFHPAGPLLAAAPWAITRGNHELCDRAAAGWYRFLDYRQFPASQAPYSPDYQAESCSNYTDPLAVRLGDLQLILMDVGGLADSPAKGRNQGWTNGDHVRTARQLSQLSRLPETRSAKISWLVTHKPLFAFYSGGKQASSSTWQFQKAIQPGVESFAAGNGLLPANLQMVHSGHIHGWQMISHPEDTGLPTQYLIGMSGQALEGLIQSRHSAQPYQALAPQHQAYDIPAEDKRWPWEIAPWSFRLPDGRMARPDAFSTSPIVAAGTEQAHTEEFGFAVFDRVAGTSNWTARLYDPERRLLRTCVTEGKRSRCTD